MGLFTKIDIRTYDSEDELIFIANRQRNWTDWIGVPLLIVVTAIAWKQGNVIFALLCIVIGGIALIANWMHGPATRLQVAPNQIYTTGNLQRIFTTEIRISTSKITSIDFSSGGENEPSGLYVWQGWSSTCILPDISREQAESIRNAIANKFPEIKVNNQGPASLLHSDSSGITTLGLSPAHPESSSDAS